MEIINRTAIILTLLGAFNWGLVGLFGFDLVAALFGIGSLVSRIIYILIGASAVYSAFLCSSKYRVTEVIIKK